MSEKPPVKKASPHDVKKAFGANAARVLDVIDNHADSIEGLIAQVERLTVAVHGLQVANQHADYEREQKPRIVLPS